MTALTTLVDSLKREIAVPGTFEAVFPDTTDIDLLGALADGFSEAQLRGFFPDMELAPSGGPPPTEYTTSEDLSLGGGALVIIFTSMRFIRAQIRALSSAERYKAGPVEFEIQKAASVLAAELKYLEKRLDDLIEDAKDAARPLAAVYDNYLARTCEQLRGIGFYAYEYRG